MVLTVTGLLAGETATITQATNKSGFTTRSKSVTGRALIAALTPNFGTPSATTDGFSVSITNYSTNYNWDTLTVSRGTVAVTSTIGSTRVLTVTGLSAGETATITQLTTRTGYVVGSNTVVGTALGAALNPIFGPVTRTANGFNVSITNGDANYTWDTPTVTRGSVVVTSVSYPILVLRVTGLAASETATITQATTRTGYSAGSNTVTGSALSAALNPTFGPVIRTADGFSVSIENYDANYTWDSLTVTSGSGSVAVTSISSLDRLLTVSGLSAGDSATTTLITSRSGYSDGSSTVAGTALNAPLNPTFGTVTRTITGFSVPITNFDSNFTWNTPTVTSGSVAVAVAVSTANTGDAWSAQTTAPDKSWQSIASSSDGTKLAAVVLGGSIWTSSNSGASWTEQTNSGTRDWISIASSSDGSKLVAAVYGGYIYTSSDSGATWIEKRNSKVRNWRMVTSSVDGANIAAVESDGRLNTSSDYGNNWTRSGSPNRNWTAITSSSDGTKLAAVVSGGFIYTSTDSGANWTAQTNAGSRDWRSISSSSDGTKLAAVAYGDYIYTSTDSGVTWTARWQGYGKYWFSITSSSDGTKIAAAVTSGYIYTSTDSGATWTEQTNSGSRAWLSIVSSSDGSKYAAAVENGKIYTFAFRVLTVTGLSAGDSATITQTTSRSNYASGSSTVTGAALTPLNPTFGSVTRAANGFNVSITNYDANFTFDTPTVTSGRVSITSTIGATRVLTVTGLAAGDTATVTQSTSRTNYPNGSNTVVGSSLSAALNPGFDTITATADGYSVSITNYDSNFTWDTPTVTSGSVAITSTIGATRVLTVSGLSANGSATITQSTSRSGYEVGSNTVTSKTINYALNPTFGTVTRTATGFTVPITNYDSDFTWDTPIVSNGTVSVSAANSSANWTEQRDSGARVWEFIASSSDGSKLAAVVKDGYIYTSTNSGVTWTEHASVGARLWRSIASSSDGTKLAATVYGGYIWTSTDSGATWTERTSSGQRDWRIITSSSDGTKLSAIVNGDYIYTSDDSGVTWTARTGAGSRSWRALASSSDGTKLAAAAWSRNISIWTSTDSGATWIEHSGFTDQAWRSITSSSDGTKLEAVAEDGFIYTSINSGVSWTEQTNLGIKSWRSVTSSSDGTKIAAVALDGFVYISSDTGSTWTAVSISGSPGLTDLTSNSDGTKIAATVFGGGYIYTYSPRVLLVTGLAASETATVTQATRRINYPAGSNSVIGTALNAELNPSFGIPTVTADGFDVAVTNYDANYTWDTPTVSRGTVAVTSTNGATRILSVTGLSVGDSATVTQTTSRIDYVSGSSSVTGTVLTTITTANVIVATPVTGATPVSSIISNGQYTTAITWNGSPTTFASNTVYTATVTVTPIFGYTLTGVAANLFTVNGESSTVGNLTGAGSFTKTFPVTATTISHVNISIAAPVIAATPVTATTGVQYNTTISWSNSPTRFAGVTAYTATVTVTPNPGYTLSGVVANFFRVNSDTATTGNLVNAGAFTYRFATTGPKLVQTITFAQPSDMVITSVNQALTATSSALGSYAVTLSSTTTNTCTIESGAIHVVAAGICSIRATQAGDGIYVAAASVIRSISISVNKFTQSITFTQPAAMNTRSGSQALTATSSAGNSYAVTLTSNYPLICSISNRAIVVVKSGTCSITASQSGDGTYQSATSITKTFVISKATQTITFNQPAAMSVTSDTQTLTATSSAGGSYPISFASADSGICAIESGSVIRVVSAGTCSITASQAGDDTYTAAASVVKTFVIGKLAQAINFNQPNAMTMTSADQLLSATSNATGAYSVSYQSTTAGVCTISAIGADRFVHVIAPGTCSITASQPGDPTYAAAVSVVKTLVVAKIAQSITFIAPEGMTMTSGDQVLNATSSAGGSYPVRFTSTTTSVCKVVDGNILRAVSAGTCSVIASQPGDARFLPANNVSRSLILSTAKRK